jgi:hypothetical protein
MMNAISQAQGKAFFLGGSFGLQKKATTNYDFA